MIESVRSLCITNLLIDQNCLRCTAIILVFFDNTYLTMNANNVYYYYSNKKPPTKTTATVIIIIETKYFNVFTETIESAFLLLVVIAVMHVQQIHVFDLKVKGLC